MSYRNVGNSAENSIISFSKKRLNCNKCCHLNFFYFMCFVPHSCSLGGLSNNNRNGTL